MRRPQAGQRLFGLCRRFARPVAPMPNLSDRRHVLRLGPMRSRRLSVLGINGMKEVAKLLNDMVTNGVISDYAVFGAIAQMRYTEAVATLDADILVAVPEPDRIDVLAPIYAFCKSRGYEPEGEAIRVGAWPVQLVPTFDELTTAAMQCAEEGDVDGVPLRVVGPDYLAVMALKVGRAKDFARILSLLENEAVRRGEMADLAAQHGLADAWKRFARRFLDD